MQHGEVAVVGPEVVAPLADAVGFVDGKQAQLAALKKRIQQGQEARVADPLRRGVEKGDFAAQQLLLNLVSLITAEGGVQKRCAHTGFVQRAHLVVHQRNQRGDDQCGTQTCLLAGNGRHLVAQAFAAPGGHQHQRVTPGDHMFHDGFLWSAEGRVTKNIAKNRQVRH